MSRPAIEVQNLSKKYHLGMIGATTLRDDLARIAQQWFGRGPASTAQEFWALRDVSFEVQPGEIVGIVGRNGAGKSTLLKILSRITEPTSGRARMRGRVASLLEVGTGFHPDLTGRENVFLNGTILGLKQAEITRRFDEIVAFAEVERFIDTPVKHYSSGMHVRLAFAVAAHLEPEILIVDEVLAVGDLSFQKKCLGKIGDVAGAGTTVLFVSHSPAAIRSLCTRAVVLESGQVRFAGAVGEALGLYAAAPTLAATDHWQRDHAMPQPEIRFESVSIQLQGHQPALTLECDCRLICSRPSGDCFVAVDICDQTMTTIMQALPETRPFLRGIVGSHRVHVTIKLPALIPGMYTANFWVGRHFTETVDHVRNAIAFEITESPSPGRSYPHGSEHGWVVPTTEYAYTPPSGNSTA